MINTRFQLVESKKIVANYYEENLSKSEIVIKPLYLSICKADQRYYLGERKKEILDQKLPMALIHEAIGKVVHSKNTKFNVNDTVVLLPNIITNNSSHIKENYDSKSKFRGSNCDGFMQELIFTQEQNVLKIPQNEMSLVLLELMSVSMNAINNSILNKNTMNSKMLVYGDGSVAYITAIILAKLFPASDIIVIGKHKEKLEYFTFINKKILVTEIFENLDFDIAFECVGGEASEDVIDDIINKINPQGTICLLGVSEKRIPINTRLILEKGLTIVGNSRSGYDDFVKSIELIETYPEVIKYLNNIISDVIPVDSLEKIDHAFAIDIINDFKTVMKWEF